MTDAALSAFAQACVTTLIASGLLMATLVVFRMWDGSLYSQKLLTMLGLDCDASPSSRASAGLCGPGFLPSGNR